MLLGFIYINDNFNMNITCSSFFLADIIFDGIPLAGDIYLKGKLWFIIRSPFTGPVQCYSACVINILCRCLIHGTARREMDGLGLQATN